MAQPRRGRACSFIILFIQGWRTLAAMHSDNSESRLPTGVSSEAKPTVCVSCLCWRPAVSAKNPSRNGGLLCLMSVNILIAIIMLLLLLLGVVDAFVKVVGIQCLRCGRAHGLKMTSAARSATRRPRVMKKPRCRRRKGLHRRAGNVLAARGIKTSACRVLLRDGGVGQRAASGWPVSVSAGADDTATFDREGSAEMHWRRSCFPSSRLAHLAYLICSILPLQRAETCLTRLRSLRLRCCPATVLYVTRNLQYTLSGSCPARRHWRRPAPIPAQGQWLGCGLILITLDSSSTQLQEESPPPRRMIDWRAHAFHDPPCATAVRMRSTVQDGICGTYSAVQSKHLQTSSSSIRLPVS